MFSAADHVASYLPPVDTFIEFLVDQTTNGNVVASDKVQAMGSLRARFRIICGTNDALDGFIQHDIGQLVAGQKNADQGTSICCNNKDFLCIDAKSANPISQRQRRSELTVDEGL